MQEGRLAKLRNELLKMKCDAFLVTNPAKIRYLTGFSGEGTCLVTTKDIHLITDNRYAEQALKEAQGCQVIAEFGYSKSVETIRQLLRSFRIVYFETDLFYNEYHLFRESRSDNDFMPVPASFNDLLLKNGLIDKLAAIKDEDEIRKIQKAVELTEDIFKYHVLPQIRPGITENDLASEITRWGKKYGAEKDAFEIDVASGAHSSLPHAKASPNELKEGDIVQFDFGYVVDGYPSDFSRVVFLGRPTEKQKKIYELVLTAQEAAIKAACPGMKCEELDKVARDIIESKGYDIPHSLGHGLGILIHTLPRVGPGEETELEPGHVITIEPGVYIPGWGGIRIEDVIVITEDGCRNLTKFSKDLTVVPDLSAMGTDPTKWGFSPS